MTHPIINAMAQARLDYGLCPGAWVSASESEKEMAIRIAKDMLRAALTVMREPPPAAVASGTVAYACATGTQTEADVGATWVWLAMIGAVQEEIKE